MPHNSLLEIVKRIQRVYSADTAKVLLKSKLIVTTTKKAPQRSSTQCSKTLDMTGLIDTPRKSSTVTVLP